MKKLTLDLDKLVVESFASTSAAEKRGTVRGNESVHPAFQYTGDQFNSQCHSEWIECEPTQYYNQTCDPSGPRPCSCPSPG